ncbi:MAG TPA: hypothetical protein VMZ53_03670 [Kofleriaceae bacterium]|nr:hypothetical protein [Kofleriaceae bacterium]
MITVALLEALIALHVRKRPPMRRVLAFWRWRTELMRLEDARAEARLAMALQVSNG